MTRPRTGLWLGAAVLAVLTAMAAFPGLFTSVDPDAADIDALLRPPGDGHWLGTDQNGRDLYARIVHGTRPSLLIGVGAVALALVGGTLVGVAAAQLGRFADQAIGRFLDVLLSVPGLLLVFLVVAVLGPGAGARPVGLARRARARVARAGPRAVLARAGRGVG
ncbi:ABC transporter permease, partial [Streptomyces sp. NPDC058861]|uniref:ABC transporter permease n=1 Tax=Streptomyces sp. NPDC058861 TaxID=3346653 RepID=UPI003677BF72